VCRRGSVKENDAAPTEAHDYYNVENANRTDDTVTPASYQQVQIPPPMSLDTALYSRLTPADERWTITFNLAAKPRDAFS